MDGYQCKSYIEWKLMATFAANPDDDNEPWIEHQAIEHYGFRIWHLMFFCLSGFTALMVLIFCCIKIRVPRTKQEIEADYRRKKLANKFRERLKLIRNQEMNAMDLQRALEIIQEDYKKMRKDIDEGVDICHHEYEIETGKMKAEPQQPSSFARKISLAMKATRAKPHYCEPVK